MYRKRTYNTIALGVRHRRKARPGTVLVMVVAMLSALFIVGAVFLSSVTFESSSIAKTERVEKRCTVIDQLSREIRAELKRGFLGNDGKAWNRDDTVAGIGNDTYGEVAGVHPLIASIEPYTPNPGSAQPDYHWYQSSDLEMTLRGESRVGAVVDTSSTADATNLVHINAPLAEGPAATPGYPVFDMIRFDSPEWIETLEGDTHLEASLSPIGKIEVYRRDADGDGVWDSYEYRLPEDRYPLFVRGDLADQLRQPDFDIQDQPRGLALDVNDPDFGADAVFYSIRVIPHGGMVNVAHGHRTLLEAAVTPDVDWDGDGTVNEGFDYSTFLAGPYVPEGEEIWLRRRYMLPPNEPVLSKLQSRELSATLNGAFVMAGDDVRWWPYDTGLNGSDVTTIDDGRPNDTDFDWLDRVDFDRVGFDAYAYRQLITTASHDDQLMRMGRDAGVDWADRIVNNPAEYSLDEWPDDTDPDNPLRARLKVSLPGLVQRLLLESGDVLFDFDTNPRSPYNPEIGGPLVDAIGDPRLPDAIRTRFIQTIRDAFTLMLRNVDDPNRNGTNWQSDTNDQDIVAETAAGLTANLIDFVDSDDSPTRVEIAGTATGLGGQPSYVYGYERQPFITEVYAADDGSGNMIYAVELFNPYPEPIDLSEYWIATEDTDPELYNVNLNGQIGGQSFLVVSNNLGALGLAGGIPQQEDTDLDIDVPGGQSKFMLLRRFTMPVNRLRRWIIADWMSVPGNFGQAGTPLSIRRDTGGSVGGSSIRGGGGSGIPWLAPVENYAGQGDNSDNLGAHAGFGTPRPVELYLANSGNMATAFPTTGTLLLLPRYAHRSYDWTDFDSAVDLPITARLGQHGLKVDNGRMPVFDTDQATDELAHGDDGDPATLELSVPWGQLVFDYFTALPLDNKYDLSDTPTDSETTKIEGWMPTVDQGGLRVQGRIDLNSAPWKVLAGLPLVPSRAFDWPPVQTQRGARPQPNPVIQKLETAAGLDRTRVTPLGEELARAIVAYREGRNITMTTGAAVGLTGDYGDGTRARTGSGFLTVGELANVRHAAASTGAFRVDGGAASFEGQDPSNDDYISAVAKLVALGDWVTTRSHVFTVYGTLRGVGEKSAVDQRAIRFQETFDRLPSLRNNLLPKRIGPRIVGPYAQAGRD